MGSRNNPKFAMCFLETFHWPTGRGIRPRPRRNPGRNRQLPLPLQMTLFGQAQPPVSSKRLPLPLPVDGGVPNRHPHLPFFSLPEEAALKQVQ